jgi:hypothetical protein
MFRLPIRFAYAGLFAIGEQAARRTSCFPERAMNPRKDRQKNRRRARQLAEEAWEAAHAQNLDLGLKIIGRAIRTQPDNPSLYIDEGMMKDLVGDDRGAERGFRNALRLAPEFAEACAHLAGLCARHGRLAEALDYQEQAVHHAPDVVGYQERLAAYRALAEPPHQHRIAPAPDPGVLALWEERLAGRDWSYLAGRLTAKGHVVLPRLLEPDTCVELSTLFDRDDLFVKTVVMDQPNFGKGTYRYFRPPLPPLVAALRSAMYPHLSRVANAWQQLLCEASRYPDTWEGFRDVCHAAGQTKSTPILLKYTAGGFNALHRDLLGEVFFPFQLAVVLSPAADDDPADEGFHGGEFLLADVGEGRKAKTQFVPLGLGDAVVFCTRDRLAMVGGHYGFQGVMHGAAPITTGTRLVLGVPFHEYR